MLLPPLPDAVSGVIASAVTLSAKVEPGRRAPPHFAARPLPICCRHGGYGLRRLARRAGAARRGCCNSYQLEETRTPGPQAPASGRKVAVNSYFVGLVATGFSAAGGVSALMSAPVLPLYSRTTPSWPPAATTLPSSLTATVYRKSVPPVKLKVLPPLSAFHTRTDWS